MADIEQVSGPAGPDALRGRLRTGFRRGAYEAKTIVARYATVAVPIARRRHGFPVSRDSDIVIEGFPRSGNTFAVVAFVQAQPGPVKVAGRVHAPAQILAAARWRIPAIVLLREPEEVVPSFVVRHPHISLRQALRGWMRFYTPLLAHRDRFVVARFEDITSDYGNVIRRVNQRFGSRFSEFQHSGPNVRRVWEAIDRDYADRVGGSSAEFDRIVARPSEAREAAKDRLRQAYRRDVSARARLSAHRVFEALAS